MALVGWLGNACFFSRFLVQWLLSERARKSVAPPVFWWISLAGSTLLGVYSARESEYVLLAGFAVNGAIYARNLCIGKSRRRLSSVAVLATAGAAAVFLLLAARKEAGPADPLPAAWQVCGVVGQAIWSSRFVVQWQAAERSGRSQFPRAFWYLSLLGNALLLSYALRLGDAVFIAGLAPGPVVQLRNIALIHRSCSPGPGRKRIIGSAPSESRSAKSTSPTTSPRSTDERVATTRASG
jgi:lipid-A-disaccharide synthase-like uncharacterized protein